jgi:hypothetical protein
MSTTTGSTPIARSDSTLSGLRVVPITVMPAARNKGTSRRPITPVAPARKILMIRIFAWNRKPVQRRTQHGPTAGNCAGH